MGRENSTIPVSQDAAVVPPARVRHPLQRKLLLWTLLMAVAPTVLCAVVLTELARGTMGRMLAQDAVLMARTVAAALGQQPAASRPDYARQVFDSLQMDQRLAFVALLDPDGNSVHRRVVDNPTWAQYQAHGPFAPREGAFDVDGPLTLGQGDMVVVQTPVRQPAGAGPAAATGPAEAGGGAGAAGSPMAGGRRVEGFLVLALREHNLPAALSRLRWTQFLAAGAVCLVSLPVILWGVRRWTRPIRKLTEATARLAAGHAAEPVRVDTGDELGLLATGFNAMAARLLAARQELERANLDLERQVARRTAELQQVNQQLQTEVQQKNDFLRAVSHDLGAPLRNIAGMTSLLLLKHRRDLADDALGKLERIGANVKLQVELIDDLLELSRIRTRPGRKQTIDLAALLEEVRQSLSFDLEKAGVELLVAEGLPSVLAERTRIRQVFQNLIDNAIKYMADAPVRQVRVTCAEQGRFLHFVVADTGPGVSPADVPHLFQVFRRGKRPDGPHVSGRGLGLAGAKAIVESYGGTMWVETHPGEGCAFHFTLEMGSERISDEEEVEADLSAAAHSCASSDFLSRPSAHQGEPDNSL